MKMSLNQINTNNTNTIMPLIYTNFDDKSYLYSNEDGKGDLYVPLNVDTEFYNRPLDDPLLHKNPSQTITVQVRGIGNDKGKIYTHQDSKDIARHDLFTESFIGFQYLKDCGYDIEYDTPKYITTRDQSLPKIHFHLYLHFACADLIRIFQDDFQKDVRELIVNGKNTGNGQGITQNRRLQTFNRFKGIRNYKPYCQFNWYVKYQNQKYQVIIGVYDTVGIAGNKSYSDLADLVGFDLPYKDLLKKEDKENMVNTYLENENFDNYAIGDLYAYELILGFNNRVNHLQQVSLDVREDNLLDTKMTIGSTIAHILENQIKSFIPDKKLFSELTKNANSDKLRKEKDTRAILSKVDGGRCFNNRPLDIVVTKKGDYKNIDELISGLNILCDVDISGAYGKGLILQDYPLGKPKMFSHQLDKDNKYYTLREFLSQYGNELVDGLWIMRVSTIKALKHPQDLITSWVIDPKKIDRLTDPTNDDLSVDYPKEGFNKIFTNEINLGLITSDILQWIDNICSQSQRKELYDNLYVINTMWYDKRKELKSVDEVIEKLKDFNDQDESYFEGDNLVSIQKDSYYWCRINLGDLFIKSLISTRNKYPKKEYPNENEFYKLCINTTYGVLVSKFFDVSNTVVGNNITARCRCMMWYLEKGLNGFQSITDGCIFELDNVCYPVDGKRLTANNLVKGYQYNVRDRYWKTDKLKVTPKQKLNVTLSKDFKIIDVFNSNIHIDYSKYVDNPNDEDEIIKLKNEIREFTDYVKSLKKGDKVVWSERIEKIYKDLVKENTFESIEYSLSDKFYKIEEDILNHLRNLFPKVDVLHKKVINQDDVEQIGYYTLEIKCFANKAIFHANADYYLEGVKELKNDELVDVENKIKMRGYKKKDTFIFDSNDGLEYLEDNEESLEQWLFSELDDNEGDLEDINLSGVNVPEKLFKGLNDDCERVTRFDYFIVNKIIKCKDFKQNQKTYKNTNLEIGYTIPQCKLLTELVLSQFAYPDIKTFESWKEKHYKHKFKYGQGYESCFLNDDGTLNYKLMIETIDQKIKEGKNIKLKPIEHPNYRNYENRKVDIQNRLMGYVVTKQIEK